MLSPWPRATSAKNVPRDGLEPPTRGQNRKEGSLRLKILVAEHVRKAVRGSVAGRRMVPPYVPSILNGTAGKRDTKTTRIVETEVIQMSRFFRAKLLNDS
jgi:hypothetical protein